MEITRYCCRNPFLTIITVMIINNQMFILVFKLPNTRHKRTSITRIPYQLSHITMFYVDFITFITSLLPRAYILCAHRGGCIN